jgi:N-acetylmuramoyl-L-alanine amidase
LKKRILTLSLLLVIVISSLSLTSFASPNSYGVGVNIEGNAFGGEIDVRNSTTFVGIRKFANAMDSSASVSYNAYTKTLTVKSSKLSLVATNGKNYIEANGRYLFTSTPIYMINGRMYAPVMLLAKAFDAKISWSDYTSSFNIVRGSGGILSGDKFYREDEVYWLSKIISAEARGEIMTGKVAVGNVILNRVRSSAFPNTIYSVIFDRKNGVQFSPVANGTIYNSATADSVIAAKMCLEGYSISDEILFFMNPRIATSNWISKNRPFAFRIGNHDFYK